MYACHAFEKDPAPLMFLAPFQAPCFQRTDSFNLLVPHSECKGKFDLYKEYASVRGPNVAIPKDQLHQIKVPANTQPCNVMGIHPKMPFLKQLYDDGDASMIANMGALVEVRASVRNVGIVITCTKVVY